MLLSLTENILPFLLSAAISILLSVLRSNCSNRKIANYRNSILVGFIFKILQLALLLGNSIMLLTGNYIYFYFFHFLLSILIVVWYQMGGNQLYIHFKSMMANMIYTTLHFTMLGLFAESYLLGTNLITFANIARYIFIFIVVFYYFYSCDIRRRMKTIKFRGISGEIKKIDLEYHRLL